MTSFANAIVFEDVSFAHKGRETLMDKVNMTFKKGEVTAITGPSGSGKTTLINFFFTRCPNPLMCPAATQRLQVMLEQASEAGLTNLQVLSLSFDPEHDAPGILKDYAQAYQLDETRFRLGTGPRQALDDLRALVGIATRKDPKLVIDHTFRIVVVDRDRRILAEILGPAWSVENTLARIRKLLQEEGK